MGDYERALWLALADPHEHDRGTEVGQKKILRDNWGNWIECKRLLDRSSRRSIITFLADKPADHPDFRKAFALIQTDLRGLYLSAFQSAVWNRMLSITLRERLPSEQLVDVPLKLGPAPFLRRLFEHQAQELRELELPLPSARLHIEPGPTLSLIEQTLKEFGMELREMRVKFPRDSFFSKGDRKACVAVGQIASAVSDDEMYPGRHKLSLNFDLPRGAYATILVKRLTDAVTVPDFGEE
jgi:tRNA pseudouridine13 synthase